MRADVAKLADAPDLGSGFQKKWRFKSSHPHQPRKEKVTVTFFDSRALIIYFHQLTC
jgi:hypothetical protein